MQGSGQLQVPFLEGMLAQASTEKDVQMWKTVLQNAMSSLKKSSFTDTTTLQSRLFALDVLLRPTLLKNLLVRRAVGHLFPILRGVACIFHFTPPSGPCQREGKVRNAEIGFDLLWAIAMNHVHSAF